MIIELPFPPKKLSRNGSQKDYQGKATAARDYKDHCKTALKKAKGRAVVQEGQPIMVSLKYHAPDNRRRDLDNLLAMTKQGIDAIAEGLGVDDYRFEYTIRRGEKRIPSCVVVSI